jgi:hypothetical protein
LPGRFGRGLRPLHKEYVGADFGGRAAEISTNIFFLWAAQPPTAARQMRQMDVCQQYLSGSGAKLRSLKDIAVFCGSAAKNSYPTGSIRTRFE